MGVSTTTLLSLILGLAARLPQFGTEVLTRTAPNLLDLGIALVAGGLATYAKLRSDAVSSMAGTAIAVPGATGLCDGSAAIASALERGLRSSTALHHQPAGDPHWGLVLMAWKDRQFRHVLRRSHLSAASFLLTGLLLIPLGSSFVSLLGQARKDNTRDIVQRTIQRFLTRETLTFGDQESVDVERVDIAWDQNPPVILVVVRVADSNRPTFKEVSMVQEEINRRQPIRFRMVVQRTAVDVVGPEEEPNENSPEARQLLNPPPVPDARALEPSKPLTEEDAREMRTHSRSKKHHHPELDRKQPLIRPLNLLKGQKTQCLDRLA